MKKDLQSRREFFRNASRATLPILGIALMPNLNIFEQRKTPCGCDPQGCTGYCTGCQGCTDDCQGNCGGSSCSGGCKGTGKR